MLRFTRFSLAFVCGLALSCSEDSTGNDSHQGGRPDAGEDTIALEDGAASENQRPVALINGESEVPVGYVIRFDGTGSYDPDGRIQAHRWDFDTNDGAGWDDEGAIGEHAYDRPGNYRVLLEVTDNQGASAEAYFEVVVKRPPSDLVARIETNTTHAPMGSRILFDSAGSGGSRPIADYYWDFDANPATAEATGPFAEWVFRLPGTYPVGLEVRDVDGNTATASATIEIFDPPPIADAGEDVVALLNQPVTVDGGQSSDNNAIVSWAWDFDDSDGLQIDADKALATWTYTSDGVFVATLTVTDEAGNTSSDTTQITVSGDQPTARPGNDISADVGTPVSFDGLASTDNDGAIVDYSWDFDDSDGIQVDASGAQVQHTFTAGGIYVVTLTVTDDSGLVHSDSLIATIRDPGLPPIADAGADQMIAGRVPVTLSGVGSSDPDGSIAAYNWDFDASDGIQLDAVGPATQHVFAPGTWVVTLTVWDDDQNSATDTTTITVSSVPPVADAGFDRSGFLGTPLVFDGSASSDPDGSIVLYEWDFDLGAGLSVDATGVNVTHTFNQVGTYFVALTVTDDDGRKDSVTVIVTITDSPPDPPTNFFGAVYSGEEHYRIGLDWTPSAGATEYRVYWSTANNQPAVANATVTTDTFDASTFVEATTYYFWVEAMNAAGVSAPATTSQTTFLSPASVANPAFTNVGATEVTVEWIDTSAAEVEYAVMWNTVDSLSGVSADLIAADSEAYTVTGLDPGRTYWFWVQPQRPGVLASATRLGSQQTTPPAVFAYELPYLDVQDVAVDSVGDLYVSSWGQWIDVLDTGGNVLSTVGAPGFGSGEFQRTTGVAVQRATDALWVLDSTRSRAQRFAVGGAYVSSFGTGFGANGLAVDSAANVYVAQLGGVTVFDSAGATLRVLGGTLQTSPTLLQLSAARDVAVDSSGTVYVASTQDVWVYEFDASGAFVGLVGGRGAGPGLYQAPCGVAVDGSDNLWVADSLNDMIVVFAPDGSPLGRVGSSGSGQGQLQDPCGIDIAAGQLFVADRGNGRIQVFDIRP